jgi:hypothetical protein
MHTGAVSHLMLRDKWWLQVRLIVLREPRHAVRSETPARLATTCDTGRISGRKEETTVCWYNFAEVGQMSYPPLALPTRLVPGK